MRISKDWKATPKCIRSTFQVLPLHKELSTVMILTIITGVGEGLPVTWTILYRRTNKYNITTTKYMFLKSRMKSDPILWQYALAKSISVFKLIMQSNVVFCFP